MKKEKKTIPNEDSALPLEELFGIIPSDVDEKAILEERREKEEIR